MPATKRDPFSARAQLDTLLGQRTVYRLDALRSLGPVEQPADQLLNNLVTALGRGSTELLDNAGVVLKTSEAQERYAKSIGGSVSALTDEQKASAFKIEAMKAIVKVADETTLAYDSNSAKIVRLKTTNGNAWDESTRATVNASVTIAEALEDKSGQYGPMGPHWLERMVATAQALDTTWSPAFTRGADATAKWAADLLLAGDAYEVMAQAFNPGTLAAMDAANAKEREKRDILSEEAEFSERMAKAAANVEKANTAFLDAQAAAQTATARARCWCACRAPSCRST